MGGTYEIVPGVSVGEFLLGESTGQVHRPHRLPAEPVCPPASNH